MAESELRQALGETPEDSFALALLALTLAELDRRDEAEQAARQSVGRAPDMAFAHYSLARVLLDRNRFAEASSAIQEAVRLEPNDADYHGLRAAIEISQEHWQTALQVAETGLQCDPEHSACNNLRSMALVKLGRKSEASLTLDTTLSRNPDDSFTHANKGWTLLEQGRRDEALNHFNESLRLEPGNEWARQGLVEALKAGNPIYAIFLRYFLWMQKLSPQARWGVVIGGYFASRVLRTWSKDNPEFAPYAFPLQAAYLLFVLLTWLAEPVFNLSLFAHPLGRHALSRDQRRQATWVGGFLALALLVLIPALNSEWRSHHIVAALTLGALAIPVSAVHSCSEGWPRRVMAIVAGILVAAGASGSFISAVFHPSPKSDLHSGAYALMALSWLGSLIAIWVANMLARQPKR